MDYLSKRSSTSEFPPSAPTGLAVFPKLNPSLTACFTVLTLKKPGDYWRSSFLPPHLLRGIGGWSFIGLSVNDVPRMIHLNWWRTFCGFSGNQEMIRSSMVIAKLPSIASLQLELFFRIANSGGATRSLVPRKLDPPETFNAIANDELRLTEFHVVTRVVEVRGECIVTIEDVLYIFGLPIDGKPVMGRTDNIESLLDEQCMACFGRKPGRMIDLNRI
ncbi:hypothetical protein PIB30_065054 [Stylosanthes scabra]|uniref:Uncharacterized protein n=1 Tax=Stylosanthes scabra TaxID=79078 RepID=A0ABU6UMJ4_9FABA|nr:hypothetical protein [Stylosanthes scabra]